MSLHPQAIPPVPEETARVARASLPRGNTWIHMRDEFGIFFRDENFLDVFSEKGQPAESAWRLALVMVMQYAEGLTDRQAAEAVKTRIDWKYALSLEITDPGFDFSVLSEFRGRLLTNQAERRLFDVMLSQFRERGWVKERGKQRIDSTHVRASIRAVNRLECVGETMRHALNILAEVAPDWLLEQMQPQWAKRYQSRFSDFRLPKEEKARRELAEERGAEPIRQQYLSAVLPKVDERIRKGVFIHMAYSEILADRIRQALAHLSSVKEQKMFGGISFMVNGKLCVGVYSSGDMILRCDPEVTDELLTKKGVRCAEMRGKPMAKGWLLISSEGMTSQKDFDDWIEVALDFNRKIR